MFERELLERVDAPARQRRHDPTKGPEAEILDLQHRAGNRAVTTLVQRDRAASTDAPGAKKKGRKPDKAAPKPAAKDIPARVLKVEVAGDQRLVTLSKGQDQGVKVGMAGSLIAGGKEYADFTITEVQGGRSIGSTSATTDQISKGLDATIKASKFSDESQAGKEY